MLSDKVCVVTGAGRGIGEATAVELGRLGASVVVNDLGTSVEGDGADEEPAQSTASDVREAGGEAMTHFGDVTSLEYTQELITDTVDEFGRVDSVVNFAGVLRDSMSYNMTEEEWDTVIHVHLRGHFALLRTIAQHWRNKATDAEDGLEQQRSFLGVTSRSALGNVGQLNYSAAKAGVMGMIRTAARELHRYNVRVNALMPTAFTRMIEEIPEEKRPFQKDEFPPEKIAPVVAYLASDEAEDINGCTIRAAGDQVGLVSDPEISRVAFQNGGWTAEDLANRFRETVAYDTSLEKSGN